MLGILSSFISFPCPKAGWWQGGRGPAPCIPPLSSPLTSRLRRCPANSIALEEKQQREQQGRENPVHGCGGAGGWMQSGKQEPWPRGINLPFLGEARGQPLTRVKCRGGGAHWGERDKQEGLGQNIARRWGGGGCPALPAPIPSTMASLLGEGDGKL